MEKTWTLSPRNPLSIHHKLHWSSFWAVSPSIMEDAETTGRLQEKPAIHCHSPKLRHEMVEALTSWASCNQRTKVAQSNANSLYKHSKRGKSHARCPNFYCHQILSLKGANNGTMSKMKKYELHHHRSNCVLVMWPSPPNIKAPHK